MANATRLLAIGSGLLLAGALVSLLPSFLAPPAFVLLTMAGIALHILSWVVLPDGSEESPIVLAGGPLAQ